MTTDQLEDKMTEPTPVESPPDPIRKGGSRGRYVLLGVAALLAITGSFAWWQASHDDDIARAETRDTVLIKARQHIATLNSLDYRKVDKGVKAWSDVTTGTLHDQLTQVDAQERRLLAEQKKISTGKVVDAAVLELDGSTASVIASVEVTVRDAAKPDSEPTLKRNRFIADLQKAGGTWKLESLQQVAVNVS